MKTRKTVQILKDKTLANDFIKQIKKSGIYEDFCFCQECEIIRIQEQLTKMGINL